MKQVQNKKDMYKLYHAGKFGNKLQTWDSLEEFKKSFFDEPVVLRYKGPHGGAWTQYNIPTHEIQWYVDTWVSEGAKKELITVNECAPDELLLIQGEIQNSIDFIDLRYTLEPLPMKLGLAKQQYHTGGIKALTLLKQFVDPSSYDWIMELLQEYPTSVIEFSTWKPDIGCIPHRNTVVWEVRNY